MLFLVLKGQKILKKTQLVLIEVICCAIRYMHFWHGVEKKRQEIKKQKREEIDSETKKLRRM